MFGKDSWRDGLLARPTLEVLESAKYFFLLPTLATLFDFFYWILGLFPSFDAARMSIDICIAEFFCPHSAVMAAGAFYKTAIYDDRLILIRP